MLRGSSQGLATVDFISAWLRRAAEELDPPGSNLHNGASEMCEPLRAVAQRRGASPRCRDGDAREKYRRGPGEPLDAAPLGGRGGSKSSVRRDELSPQNGGSKP